MVTSDYLKTISAKLESLHLVLKKDLESYDDAVKDLSSIMLELRSIDMSKSSSEAYAVLGGVLEKINEILYCLRNCRERLKNNHSDSMNEKNKIKAYYLQA